MSYDDAVAVEACITDVTLTDMEEYSCAYVAGWLEFKCSSDITFSEDEPILDDVSADFIKTVSRGNLIVPHICTYEFVKTSLRFMKYIKHDACCRQKLIQVLDTINNFFDYGVSSKHILRRLSNVLLHGLHKLEKDQQTNSKLYQTSIKKARLQ